VTAGTIPPDTLRRVLVRFPNWLGDTVMALPALRSLRDAAPAAELWCLGPWVGDVLADEPGIARRLPPSRNLRGRLSQARRLARARFDLALILPNSLETALAGWLARARWRVGYAAEGRGVLLTHALRADDGFVHQSTAYLRLLRPLGIEERRPEAALAVDPARRSEARRLLDQAEPAGRGPRVGLQLGAALGPAKLWAPERFAMLAMRLEARGIRPVLLGSAAARGLAERVQAAAGRGIPSLVGRDRPAILAALLAELDAFVGADSGPAHVAAAVGVPTVTLFGPTDPRLTAPLGSRQRALWHPPPCAPCLRPACPIDHRCLGAIEVAEVEAAVVAALAARG
jgi:heptosyltransferase-2